MLRRIGLIVLHALAILWASPWTLIGLCIGLLGLATGGHARRRGRILEFYGGAVTWLLKKLPTGQLTLAMTWGHVVLGQTDASLDIAREHEMVHVRQYEHWGPFFGPAYVLCSLVLWFAGKNAYRDNPFEVQAYDEAG